MLFLVSTLSDQYSPPPAISAAAASSPTPSTEAVQCTPSGKTETNFALVSNKYDEVWTIIWYVVIPCYILYEYGLLPFNRLYCKVGFCMVFKIRALCALF